MDLNCAFKYGLSSEFVKKNLKDWSLGHDVKLLKYLETFSDNLISRASDALKCVEDFENDLYFVSLNIQTLSQSFQSLANKQFVEHCVLEDDISSYSKPSESKSDVVSNASSNQLLTSALSSCLTSFQFKCMGFKDGYSVSNSNHVHGAVNPDGYLPPLLGTQEFTNFYDSLLNLKENVGEPMKMSKVNLEGTSENQRDTDKQSLQDTISLCSTNVIPVVPDNVLNNRILDNQEKPKDDLSTCSNVPQEKIVKNEEMYPESSENHVKPSNTATASWIPPDNPFFIPNGFDRLVPPPQTNSLFDDDDDDDECNDDLFLFGNSKPFDEECDVTLSPDTQDVIKPIDESDRQEVHTITPQNKIDETSRPKNVIEDLNNDLSKKTLQSDKKHTDMTDKICDNTRDTFSAFQSSFNVNKIPQISYEQNKPNPSQKISSGLSKPPLTISDSSKSFSLFSDQDESDDELFSSKKQKQAKEDFKKVLEGKIGGIGIYRDNNKPSFKKSEPVSTSNEAVKAKDDPINSSLNLPIGIHREDSGLPDYHTSTLQSLVKNRPKIRNKRKPPSRKHLKDFQSNNANILNNTNQEPSENKTDKLFDPSPSNTLSVLSPSTEEEDLFIVPTIPRSHEMSCSNLFVASSLLSPGSSLDNHNLGSDFDSEEKDNSSDFSHTNSVNVSEKSEYGSSLSKNDTYVSSGTSPSNVTIISNEEKTVDIKVTSNAFWNNSMSLFNDSEEDEDDLFSCNSNKKMTEKTTPGLKSKNITLQKPQNINNKSDRDLFKDIFSNDTDDDELFKTKETASLSNVKAHSTVTKVKDEKLSSRSESCGNKLSKASITDIKDPLSNFNEHLTD